MAGGVVKIFAVDPGLCRTGWGLVEFRPGGEASYLASGTIAPDPGLGLGARLAVLHRELAGLLEAHRPERAAVEEVFVNRNPAASLALGQARGAALLALAEAGLEPRSLHPLVVKRAVTGNGRAPKEQVGAMVHYLLPAAALEKSPDALDALAVALAEAQLGASPALEAALAAPVASSAASAAPASSAAPSAAGARASPGPVAS